MPVYSEEKSEERHKTGVPGVADLWYPDSYVSEPVLEDPGRDETGDSQISNAGEMPVGALAEFRRPLPAWAHFMADIGSDIALISLEEPTTAVVSLPTREFAAAFAAAAVVIGYDDVDPAAPDDLEVHLADLREMALGTRVQYRAPNGKVFDGRWRGIQVAADGQERLCMELRKKETRMIVLHEGLRVVPTGEQAADDARLRERNVKTSHLVRAMRGQAGAVAFATTTRCDVVIIGVATDLRADMCDQGFFASEDEGNMLHGYLQDIARAEQFPGSSQYFRSQVVSPSAADSDENRALQPRVVIYDGGRMFLQCSHLWPASHRIVVLDRSAASAEDAALEINLDYADRRGDCELGEDLDVPDGVEFIAYRHSK